MPHADEKQIVDAQKPNNPWGGFLQDNRYFEDDLLKQLVGRVRDYAEAGICVHLCGPAGLGKTALAVRVAQEMGRPFAFMTGNEWLSAHDFLGREVGNSTSTVVDKYVQSVRRTERQNRIDWGSSVLASAMKNGHTLIYDEFTRATPEANSALLSVIEEGVLISTDPANPEMHLQAHPDFRLLLTSNPHDYQAVNAAPDALLDRVLTIPIVEPGPETAAGIVAYRTGLDVKESRRIVNLVLSKRQSSTAKNFSFLRTVLLIARIVAAKRRHGKVGEASLMQIVNDVFIGRGLMPSPSKTAVDLPKIKSA